MSPVVEVLVCAAVGTLVVGGVFSLFRVRYQWADLAMASFAAALIALIPVVGGILSLFAMVGLLHLRCGATLFPDILVAVFVARLTMVPALIPFALHS